MLLFVNEEAALETTFFESLALTTPFSLKMRIRKAFRKRMNISK
jgi:hypothetical protein